jgi:two-component system CheB/CheR fusion protein
VAPLGRIERGVNVKRTHAGKKLPSDEKEDCDEIESKAVPVVGIGASAGGLEALQALFQSLPDDSGMAFVVIQHLDPKKKSALVEILSKETRMPVTEVSDAVSVSENSVYVIPPASDLTLTDGHLHLSARIVTGGQHLSIDTFFQTLGRVGKSRAIGVILSGSGSDGALGVQIIKSEGGLTFAQDEKSAKFPDMPLAAVETGCIDFVLDPPGIAGELKRISHHPFLRPLSLGKQKEAIVRKDGFDTIVAVLTDTFNVDFINYKQSTLRRRILRRMFLNKIETPESYIAFLDKNAEEVQALYNDLLINVTDFFRDREVFEHLKDEIFPSIIKDRLTDDPIRIWVPGCSTGQEVYSLLIVLFECLGNEAAKTPIQVFATDISERSIEKARRGIYRANEVKNISPARLAEFFYKVDSGYKICKPIRDVVIFAAQNVTADPPFSNIDLISCRNLLIYLGQELQKKVLPIFHYSLRPKGVLLLGTSEAIGVFSNLFSAHSSGHKVFSKKPIVQRPSMSFSPRQLAPRSHKSQELGNLDGDPMVNVQKEADRVVLEKFSPSRIIINEDFEIMHSTGDTSPFVSLASGAASLNLLKMVRQDLEIELRSALQKCKKSLLPTKTSILQVKYQGGPKEFCIDVVPIVISPGASPNFLVLFTDVLSAKESPGTKSRVGQRKLDGVNSTAQQRELISAQASLQTARETLRTTVQGHDATLEELKSAHEEILSANEELQSTNEELETAKEELQSTNEELHIVNEELKNGNLELTTVNNDLMNVLANTPVPLIIVGRNLHIRRFSPTAEKTLRLRASDFGRPVKELNFGVSAIDLDEIISNVIETLTEHEREVQDNRGRWCSLQVRPYKTIENKIDGAVITLTDIETIRRSREDAKAIAQTVREPLVILDKRLRIMRASQSFYETFKTSEKETEGKFLYDLGIKQWDIASLRKALEEILEKGLEFNDCELTVELPNLGTRTMLLKAWKISIGESERNSILLSFNDITDPKMRELELVKTATNLKRVNTELEQFAFIASHDLQEPLRMVSIYMELLERKMRGKLDKDASDYFEIALGSAKRMRMLVEDLLNFSRATRAEIKYEPTDCAAVVSRILATLKPLIEECHARIEYENLPTILADELLLGQVFQNLIGNAVKFRNEGQDPKIHISAIESASEWRFAVKDNGIGISAEYKDRIFLIFQRLHNSKEYPGTGIGLAMCKNIIDRYGGQIWMESELGEGSTFFFTLPKPNK